MTLILSCATRFAAIQVSDRRLTDIRSGQVLSSTANKQVLCGNNLCFSYTGLAELEGVGTDEWLRDVLHRSPSGSVEDLAQHLSNSADAAVAKSRLPQQARRMAFVATGWVPHAEEGEMGAAILEVSNFLGENGERLPSTSTNFASRCRRYHRPLVGITSTGTAVDTVRQRWLDKRLERCFAPGVSFSPWTIIKIFVESIRQVAKVNSRVGGDLLATVMPRGVLDREELSFVSPDGTMGGMASHGDQTVEETAAELGRRMDGSRSVICLEFPSHKSDGMTYGPLIARNSFLRFSHSLTSPKTVLPQARDGGASR